MPNFSKKRVGFFLVVNAPLRRVLLQAGCKPILKVYNVSKLPKARLFESGSPKDENLFIDASKGEIVWKCDCVTKVRNCCI